MTSKSPFGDISVVTLIRTDTTLDHSQKAEKVWWPTRHVAWLAFPCVESVLLHLLQDLARGRLELAHLARHMLT